MKTLITICVLLLLYPVYTSAQSYWLSNSGQGSISFEWDKPVFDLFLDDDEKISGMSSVLFITARAKAGEKLTLVADIPISHFGGSFANYNYNYNSNTHLFTVTRTFEKQSNTALGNIYIGGEYRIRPDSEKSVSHLKFGLRLPTASEYNGEFISGSFTGAMSEFDRIGSFTTDAWLVRFLGSSIIGDMNNPVKFVVNAGMSYQVFTGEIADYLDNMMYFQYGLILLYSNDQIETYLGISGINPVHGNDASLIEDGISQARAGLGKHFNGWSASVYARRPLSDSVNDFLKFSYGIMFSFNI